MKSVIIFAGTVEGRTLSEYLSGRQIPVTACTATEYGGTLLRENPYLNVRTGRMDREQMEAFFRRKEQRLWWMLPTPMQRQYPKIYVWPAGIRAQSISA